MAKLFPIVSHSGIKRDGTQFAGTFYTDGQWCRFQRGLPRKMGGYSQIINTLPRIPRGVFVTPNSPNFNVYIGDSDSLRMMTIDQFGHPLSAPIDRTPLGYVSSPNNVWNFDIMYDTVSNFNAIIAHSPPNLGSISSTTESPVYIGGTQSNDRLVQTGTSVSGGFAIFHPFVFYFGNDGQVLWSRPSNPSVILDSARVTSQKVIAGLATRGGNSSPAGLLWSLDSVIRVTQVGTNAAPTFKFDTVSNQSSILSSRSVIEYDGLYFWAGIDRFLVYNGVVQEVLNQMNTNFFYNKPFEKLNYAQRQKVWATKVPQFGEIWWFYPSGNNTECDRAIIYNVREKTWYDTDITRGTGYFEQVFADPIWADSQPNNNNQYGLWIHESGVDKNVFGNLSPINSYFTTGDLSWCAIGPSGGWTGEDRWVDLYRVEPDFLQVGQMTLTVNGRQYARGANVASSPYVFDENTFKIDMRQQRREMNLTFQSNVIGGFYELGQTLIDLRVGDARA